MSNTNQIPRPSDHTKAPLRNRLRVELAAPIADVWALVGNHTRLPEYCGGISAVDVEGSARYCQFLGPDGGPGPRLRENVRWEAPNVGYATSVEPDNAFGLTNSFSLITVEPAASGTLFTWQEHYDAADLGVARASYDEGLADIGARLVAKFGGRVVERFVDVK